MNCSCPKCSASIEVEVPFGTEEGTAGKCPECKAKFPVRRESFAGRALWKPEEVFCVECGHHLGHSIFCPGCRAVFPDYVVMQAAKPGRETFTFWERFAIGSAAGPKVATPTYARPTAAGGKAISAAKPLKLAAAIAVVVAIAIAGTFLYRAHKAEKEYAKNFALVVYGAKLGTDTSLKACTKMAAEWKTRSDGGQSYNPRISADDEARLTAIKTEADAILQKMAKPPKKFTAATGKLTNLYGVFSKAQTLAIAPSGSLPAFTDAVGKIQGEFAANAKDLKASLPSELDEELKSAAKRYVALRDF